MKKVILVFCFVVVSSLFITKGQTADSVLISKSELATIIRNVEESNRRVENIEIRMKKFRNQNTTSHLLMLAGATISTLAYISQGSDYDKVMYIGGAVSLLGVGFYFNSYDAFNFRKKTPKIHSLYNF